MPEIIVGPTKGLAISPIRHHSTINLTGRIKRKANNVADLEGFEDEEHGLPAKPTVENTILWDKTKTD
jgi:hypothetical protein